MPTAPSPTLVPSDVITGLVPVIPIGKAPRSSDRDGRVKPGHDGRGGVRAVSRREEHSASLMDRDGQHKPGHDAGGRR
ncbi:hypothetical protein KHP60_00385 [Microvirga sp. 3-52]|uniref:hypothetical protein n=1 Tax=Microvirga sp. 3-52 TaxID=2792425 RepID=UPI001BCFCF0F|nr:hypothetical protein [Microvirga sp. 3-52]MBS7450799.1 hypothetical protein [Microvirga sp. 3-52]